MGISLLGILDLEGILLRMSLQILPKKVSSILDNSLQIKTRYACTVNSSFNSYIQLLLMCWCVSICLSLSLVSVACWWGNEIVEADVCCFARSHPHSLQRQEGCRVSCFHTIWRGPAANQHQGLSDWHLLQRHKTQECAATHHLSLRVFVPGRREGRHADLDPSNSG